MLARMTRTKTERGKRVGVALAACMLVGASCAGGAARAPAPAPSSAALDTVLARWDADSHADLEAVVVMQHGKRIAERYYNGDRPETLHDIRSAGQR